MQKNLIPQIVNTFNLTLNEQFTVIDKNGVERTCKFVTSALIVTGQDYDFGKKLLADIICGDAKIVENHWKPTRFGTYYTFGRECGEVWKVIPSFWADHPNDFARFNMGWMYRTEEAAKAALPIVAKELGVEYSV